MAADGCSPRDGKQLEVLCYYNPLPGQFSLPPHDSQLICSSSPVCVCFLIGTTHLSLAICMIVSQGRVAAWVLDGRPRGGKAKNSTEDTKNEDADSGANEVSRIIDGDVDDSLDPEIDHLASQMTAKSEFIVPYWKFLKSFNHPFCVGMRYKIQYGR
ncbi:hypothetical protein ACQ4PT_066379 [Festuca glaucescens]